MGGRKTVGKYLEGLDPQWLRAEYRKLCGADYSREADIRFAAFLENRAADLGVTQRDGSRLRVSPGVWRNYRIRKTDLVTYRKQGQSVEKRRQQAGRPTVVVEIYGTPAAIGQRLATIERDAGCIVVSSRNGDGTLHEIRRLPFRLAEREVMVKRTVPVLGDEESGL